MIPMILGLFWPVMSFFGFLAHITMINTGVLAGAGILTGLGVGVGASFIYFKVKNDPGALYLIHPYSDIAATYWTANGTYGVNETQDFNATQAANGTGTEKSLLFYQDPDAAIIVSSRSHANGTWVTANITDELIISGHPIKAKPGTPMAATTSPGSPFEAVLHFLDPFNKTVELRSKDPLLHSWVRSNPANESSVYADHYSQLATHWFKCLPDCQNSQDGVDQVRVFFQMSNKLKGAISEPWSQISLNASMTPNSAITVTPFVPPEGPVEMRLFSRNSSRLQMMTWRNETSWGFDEKFAAVKQRGSFRGQSIAATSFPAAKASSRPAWFLMVLQVQKKKFVTATYWDPLAEKWIPNKRIKFRGGGRKRCRKFTRIALGHNGTFYGIVKGRVDEYTIDAANPTQFAFSSRVALMNRLKDVGGKKPRGPGKSG